MRYRRKRNRTRRKHCRGVAAVEAAIVLPVVVLLLFGFIELGWQVNSLQIIHNAARQGARAAVRLENSNAEVEATVLSSLGKSIDVDPSAILFSATHSHSGPGGFGPGLIAPLFMGPYDDRVPEFLIEAFTTAIVQALMGMEPALTKRIRGG